MRISIAILLAAATPAHADSASEEVSAGTTLSNVSLPATEWIADRIAGAIEIGEAWRIGADLGVTHSYAPDPGVAPTDIVSLAMSGSVDLNDHWSLAINGGYSPATTSRSSAMIEIDGEQRSADLAATSSMGTIAASASYDTAGDSDRETSISIGIGVTRVESLQTISTMAAPMTSAIDQVSIDASVTRTYGGDLDLGMSATLFAYDADPTRVGYFPLVSVGRDNLGRGSGIAPSRYAIAPSIGHRWQHASVTVNLGYGSYLDGGYDLSPSVKLAYKLRLDDTGARVKLYTRLAGTWSVDAASELYATGSIAAGVQYSW